MLKRGEGGEKLTAEKGHTKEKEGKEKRKSRKAKTNIWSDKRSEEEGKEKREAMSRAKPQER